MKVTDEQIRKACDKYQTMRQAAISLGVPEVTFRRRALKIGCYQPNKSGKGTKKPKPRIPLEDILEGKHPQYKTWRLKHRLYEVGLKENKCEECGQGNIWNGKPLECELDHVNGNSTDHRLENLRILCGHCHSQTDTFRGRNKGK